MPQDPIAIKTIVTSKMAEKVAKNYGVTMIDVLTGFKFIGEQIGLLEAKGEENRYISVLRKATDICPAHTSETRMR